MLSVWNQVWLLPARHKARLHLLCLAVSCCAPVALSEVAPTRAPSALEATITKAPAPPKSDAPISGALDGEGSASLTFPDAMVAGLPTRVAVDFTVGPSGLPVGGGVSLGLHHAAIWPNLQATDPNGKGYVTAQGPASDSLAVQFHFHRPAAAFVDRTPGLGSDSLFHQTIVATVVNRPLAAGEKIRFQLGGNGQTILAPRSSDSDNEFRVTTDGDGDGIFLGIGKSPTNRVLPGDPTHLAANLPAQVKIGEPFDVLIRAEDEFHNLATGFNGLVSVMGEDGTVLTSKVPLIDGLGKTRLAVDAPGPHRLRLLAGRGTLSGRSNPARAYAETPTLKLYWGDMHGHTSVSDGLGADANEFFKFGREVAALDVVALTDHGHFDWPANIKAVQEFYTPHKYVTILAQEAGARVDHMNLYFRRDDADHISHWQTEYDAFYKHIRKQYNAGPTAEVMTGPLHFSLDRGNDLYPFDIWDSQTARFVEIYSSLGASEFPGNDRPLPGAYAGPSKYLQYGLSKGLRFGVIGTSDSHDSKPGRSIWGGYPGGLAGFWAKELTREAIWDAMWNYQVYATSLDRIYMEFRVNDQIMGSDFATTAPIFLDAYVIGKTDKLKLAVIRNNLEIHQTTTKTGLIELTLEDNPSKGSHFYYLRVTQDNGERAWSTPIWVDIQ